MKDVQKRQYGVCVCVYSVYADRLTIVVYRTDFEEKSDGIISLIVSEIRLNRLFALASNR